MLATAIRLVVRFRLFLWNHLSGRAMSFEHERGRPSPRPPRDGESPCPMSRIRDLKPLIVRESKQS